MPKDLTRAAQARARVMKMTEAIFVEKKSVEDLGGPYVTTVRAGVYRESPQQPETVEYIRSDIVERRIRVAMRAARMQLRRELREVKRA